MKISILATYILFSCICCFAQKIPLIQFKASIFTCSTYTTCQSPDYSILQRSLERREQRYSEAQDLYLELILLCKETAEKMPPSEKEWFKSYCDIMYKRIDELIERDSESAIKLLYKFMSQLRRDNEVQYRIDSYKQYCEDMEYNGLYIYKKGLVTQTAYDWFCYNNQYKFIPKYDLSGNLNGYTPVNVSYLYPSINWNEACQFITSQGKTKEDINRMWDLYFFEKKLSLIQEYEVTKFYYEYLVDQLNRSDVNPKDKERIQRDIENQMAILSDTTEISYNAFVDNLKNQLVIQQKKAKPTPIEKNKHKKRLTRNRRK